MVYDFAKHTDRPAIVTGSPFAAPDYQPISAVVSMASRFDLPDPGSIPPRPWVFGRWLLRNTVTAVVAPGGVGKSSLMAAMLLSLVTGKALLGKDVWNGPLRAWLWNLEDDKDELARQLLAAAIYYGVTNKDIAGRMFVDSGPEGATLCTATSDGRGFTLNQQKFDDIAAELKARRIDVLIIDPFVSSHQVEENDNSKIDAVAKAWSRVAKQANCSIILVHHTAKTRGERITTESSRGASSLTNAARSVLALNPMDEGQARHYGVDEADARRYFTVGDDKHNRAPAEWANWFQLASIELPNGDSLGVVAPWKPPAVMDGVDATALGQIMRIVSAGDYKLHMSAKDWVGYEVARVLKMDTDDKVNCVRIDKIVRAWIKSGALKEEPRMDPKAYKMKAFVAVGDQAQIMTEAHASPATNAPMTFDPQARPAWWMKENE